jgi:hypothetical protein
MANKKWEYVILAMPVGFVIWEGTSGLIGSVTHTSVMEQAEQACTTP